MASLISLISLAVFIKSNFFQDQCMELSSLPSFLTKGWIQIWVLQECLAKSNFRADWCVKKRESPENGSGWNLRFQNILKSKIPKNNKKNLSWANNLLY